MIRQLVRTELESYLHDQFAWGGPLFLFLVLFLSFMDSVVVARSGDRASDDVARVLLLSVGLSSTLLAVRISLRNALEKRTRLFSQLPVSARELSLASWGVRLLYLSIPTLACSVFLARAANLSFATFVVVTIATYLGGTTLVAAISVAMSLRHQRSPMSTWAKGVYIACATVAFAIWTIGNLLVLPSPVAIASPSGFGLPGLTGCLTGSAVALVALDIWLRNRAEDYLG